MKYDLVKDNQVLKTKGFTEAPPILSLNKGKWLLRVNVPAKEKPTIIQNINTVHSITDIESIHKEVLIDRFSDIMDGPTKEEQDSDYISSINELGFDRFKIEQSEIMDAKCKLGVVTSINDIHMQAGKIDQDKLVAGLLAYRNRIELNNATLFDSVIVRDINNVNHTVTIRDYMQICADVAEYCENLQHEYWTAVDNWEPETIAE